MRQNAFAGRNERIGAENIGERGQAGLFSLKFRTARRMSIPNRRDKFGEGVRAAGNASCRPVRKSLRGKIIAARKDSQPGFPLNELRGAAPIPRTVFDSRQIRMSVEEVEQAVGNRDAGMLRNVVKQNGKVNGVENRVKIVG